MLNRIRIATRQSPLALWQAEHVAALLREAHPGIEVELCRFVTEGDRILDRSLATVGGKGLFIKELERAMLDDEADIAVHSMKDVPAAMPPGFVLATLLEAASPFDALVSNRYTSFDELPEGAVVGTSSLRRQAQIRARRPDIEIAPLRGNVNTRLARLDEGRMDAIVLAVAGLERLGLGERIREALPADVCLPAIGQGVVGIECREDATELAALLARLGHAPTATRVTAERAFGARLEGDCSSPIAAHATLDGDGLHLHGRVASPDGRELLEDEIEGPAADAAALGRTLAERLLDRGAASVIAGTGH